MAELTELIKSGEIPLSLADAAKKHFKDRRIPGVSRTSLWRWATIGLDDGRKLEHARISTRYYTTLESIDRYLAACNQARPLDASNI